MRMGFTRMARNDEVAVEHRVHTSEIAWEEMRRIGKTVPMCRGSATLTIVVR